MLDAVIEVVVALPPLGSAMVELLLLELEPEDEFELVPPEELALMPGMQ